MTTTSRLLLCAAAFAGGLAGCSSGGNSADTTLAATSNSAHVTSLPAPVGSENASQSSAPSDGSLPVTAANESAPTTTALPTDPPGDTGVPGLDSDDAFCSAWSRFGGSWQVLVQVATIGATDTSRLEVIASSVVGDAFDAVFAAWPAELESERDTVADGYFGAFQRRSDEAAAALVDAGVTAADRVALAAAWMAALATYVPGAGTIAVDVPPALDPALDAAAAAFADARVPIISDPSMVITVSTPATDAYLASACPDQGWIVGADVTEG